MRWLAVAGCGLRIAGDPFLDGRARLGHLNVIADIALLVDVRVDLLKRTAIGPIEDLCRRRNGNSRVLGIEMYAQDLEGFGSLGLEHLLHLGWQLGAATSCGLVSSRSPLSVLIPIDAGGGGRMGPDKYAFSSMLRFARFGL